MRRWALPGALLLILVVNAAVLGGVAWNRSGDPVAALVLTERELFLPPGGLASRENSGVALRLKVSHYSRTPEWLDGAALKNMGFDPEWYVENRQQGHEYRKQPLPRRAYVVLEYDGAAWTALVQRMEDKVAQVRERVEAAELDERALERARRRLERFRTRASRLVPVDAGSDPASLQARYTDGSRYVITRAEIRMRFGRPPSSEDPSRERGPVYGYIGRILPGSVYVPLKFHDALQSAVRTDHPDPASGSAEPGWQPRFRVEVHYGKRYEPWIVQLRDL